MQEILRTFSSDYFAVHRNNHAANCDFMRQ